MFFKKLWVILVLAVSFSVLWAVYQHSAEKINLIALENFNRQVSRATRDVIEKLESREALARGTLKTFVDAVRYPGLKLEGHLFYLGNTPFDGDKLFGTILNPKDSHIQMQITADGNIVYDNTDKDYVPPFAHQESFTLDDKTWNIRFISTPRLGALLMQVHSNLVLFFSIFSAILLICFAYFSLLAKKKAEFTALKMANEAQSLAHLGSWQWNLGNNTENWSDEQFRIFGYEPQAFKPTYRHFIDALHIDDKEKVLETVKKSLTGQAPYRIECRIVKPSGEIRDILCQGEVKKDSKNNPITMVGTVLDITERKRVERFKNEFVSTVSHELRTPLTSIRGALGLIKGGIFGTFPEKATGFLDVALTNCERLSKLINDILDIEKIESGKMDFKLKNHNIVDIVKNNIRSNESYASQYRIKLKMEHATPEVNLSLDSDRINQVLSNLISNAVKFSPEGGEVLISIHLKGKTVRVEIHDHGPGISNEFREKLFHKFAQIDASDTRQRDGTGLGLSISKAIIEHHGGTIDYESFPGKGSIFFFELPCHLKEG